MFLKTFHIENPSVIVSTSKIESGGRRIVFIGAFIGEAGILVFIKTENLFLLKRVAMLTIILKGVRFV
jgi:hypothetical protein